MNLIDQLKRHEGLRLNPYLCTAGKLTIGYGRNLDDVGISIGEAELMLKSDVEAVRLQLSNRLPVFNLLSETRQDALINMGFNLGVNGLLRFKNMIAALESADYELAAIEMLNSKWARQVGSRANELAEQIKTGISFPY